MRKVLAPQADQHVGPWDSADASRPDPPSDWMPVELGAMLLYVPQDFEIRLEVREDDQSVLSVDVLHNDLTLQVMPYAGPRGSGIWDEVSSALAEAIATDGGPSAPYPSGYGTQLLASLKNEGSSVQARFLGFDGPRWFVRAVISGPLAHDDQAVQPFLDVINQVVVVRDDLARPMQEPLELSLPSDLPPVV